MMRSLIVLFLLGGTWISCNVNMRNPPPPEPLRWYSFAVNNLQLNDALDSLMQREHTLFYSPYRNPNNPYFSVYYVAAPGDTLEYDLAFSGTVRRWIERPDSSHLALVDIRKGYLPPDSLSAVISDHRYTDEEKRLYRGTFEKQVLTPLRGIISGMERYSITPLNIKDTLEARWIICKRKSLFQCDTVWLTSQNGSIWVLADTSVADRSGH